MTERQRISSGSPYEPAIGFSRAVRVGNMVFVAGTGPVQTDGTSSAPDDMEAQTRRCLEIINSALDQAGASLSDVVRTRMFVTDIGQWDAAGRAHAEVFGQIRPAATMVEVRALADPSWLIEIEADAVVENNGSA